MQTNKLKHISTDLIQQLATHALQHWSLMALQHEFFLRFSSGTVASTASVSTTVKYLLLHEFKHSVRLVQAVTGVEEIVIFKAWEQLN